MNPQNQNQNLKNSIQKSFGNSKINLERNNKTKFEKNFNQSLINNNNNNNINKSPQNNSNKTFKNNINKSPQNNPNKSFKNNNSNKTFQNNSNKSFNNNINKSLQNSPNKTFKNNNSNKTFKNNSNKSFNNNNINKSPQNNPNKTFKNNNSNKTFKNNNSNKSFNNNPNKTFHNNNINKSPQNNLNTPFKNNPNKSPQNNPNKTFKNNINNQNNPNKTFKNNPNKSFNNNPNKTFNNNNNNINKSPQNNPNKSFKNKPNPLSKATSLQSHSNLNNLNTPFKNNSNLQNQNNNNHNINKSPQNNLNKSFKNKPNPLSKATSLQSHSKSNLNSNKSNQNNKNKSFNNNNNINKSFNNNNINKSPQNNPNKTFKNNINKSPQNNPNKTFKNNINNQNNSNKSFKNNPNLQNQNNNNNNINKSPQNNLNKTFKNKPNPLSKATSFQSYSNLNNLNTPFKNNSNLQNQNNNNNKINKSPQNNPNKPFQNNINKSPHNINKSFKNKPNLLSKATSLQSHSNSNLNPNKSFKNKPNPLSKATSFQSHLNQNNLNIPFKNNNNNNIQNQNNKNNLNKSFKNNQEINLQTETVETDGEEDIENENENENENEIQKQKQIQLQNLTKTKSTLNILEQIQIKKNGWLKKQGAVHKNWKTRFFILTKECTMIYFKTDNNFTNPLGVISLIGAYCFKHKKKNRFQIYHSERRTFYFQCESEESRQSWIDSIQQTILESQPFRKGKDVFQKFKGYIQKQGLTYKTWKVRYFILYDYVLCYYKNEFELEIPFGMISLAGMQIQEEYNEEIKQKIIRLHHPLSRDFFLFPLTAPLAQNADLDHLKTQIDLAKDATQKESLRQIFRQKYEDFMVASWKQVLIEQIEISNSAQLHIAPNLPINFDSQPKEAVDGFMILREYGNKQPYGRKSLWFVLNGSYLCYSLKRKAKNKMKGAFSLQDVQIIGTRSRVAKPFLITITHPRRKKIVLEVDEYSDYSKWIKSISEAAFRSKSDSRFWKDFKMEGFVSKFLKKKKIFARRFMKIQNHCIYYYSPPFDTLRNPSNIIKLNGAELIPFDTINFIQWIKAIEVSITNADGIDFNDLDILKNPEDFLPNDSSNNPNEDHFHHSENTDLETDSNSEQQNNTSDTNTNNPQNPFSLSQNTIENFIAITNFSEYELKLMFSRFSKKFKQETMSRKQFNVLAKEMGISLQPKIDLLFAGFDRFKKGKISFEDLVIALNSLTRGSIDDKIHFSFCVYDRANLGKIDSKSFSETVKILFSLRLEKDKISKSELKKQSQQIFSNFDKDQDGFLSFEEFKNAVSLNPVIVECLGFFRLY
ncbi:sesquipedalian [Anaeramoeba ignava]|uniref:Sesquipedalian n=1 Tax=Anaeramoeba ignava TaxID=1746090 RepID=A0A9Q0LP68_ANAIG|nr:sesquipedalian [Anaeramoeba ignava]